MKRSLALALAMVISGCAMQQPQPSMAVYDFGLHRPTANDKVQAFGTSSRKLEASLVVAEIAAPPWLDGTVIQYRLAYQNPARSYAYADSRWAAAPAMLLTQRIRSRIAEISRDGLLSPADRGLASYLLRLELEEFSHVFDSAAESRGIIRLRASLIDRRTRSLVAQRSFSIERSAPTADARGAVHALTEASDELIVNLTGWLSGNLPAEG